MKYISISGPVAAGKTTLLNKLLDRLGDRAAAHEEQPEKNPFIHDYYSDSARWSFHSQIAFLSLYFDNADYFTQDKEYFFFDRCFIENLVLARYRLQVGDLTEDEYAVIEKLANGIDSFMPKINKYIYLNCSVPLLCVRLGNRGRDYESGLGRRYAELQKALYDDWATTLPKENTLIIDQDAGYDIGKILEFIRK